MDDKIQSVVAETIRFLKTKNLTIAELRIVLEFVNEALDHNAALK